MQLSSRRLLAIVAAGGVLGTAGAAATAAVSSAAASSSGTVHVWVTPGKGAVDQILLTGVIADHGTATTVGKNGSPDPNGGQVNLALSHGTFQVDTSAFDQKLSKVQPKVDKATCSAWGGGTGNVTLGNGTGAYAGISGTIKVTTSFAAIFPRFTSGAKKGQCNLKAAPTASFQNTISGSGHVTF
jgi:hypothetical protein